jgi:hypothetical protein
VSTLRRFESVVHGHNPDAMWKLAGLAATAVFALASLPTSAGQSATVRLQDRTPVTVAGAGFDRGERVRVTLTIDTSTRTTTRAGRRGTFRVVFAGATATRCDMIRVVAIGGEGSRAVLKILPAPACMPQRSP